MTLAIMACSLFKEKSYQFLWEVMALAGLHLDCVHVHGHIHDSEEKTEISLTEVEPGRKCSC